MTDAKLRWVIAGLCMLVAVGYFAFLIMLFVATQRQLAEQGLRGAAVPGTVLKKEP